MQTVFLRLVNIHTRANDGLVSGLTWEEGRRLEVFGGWLRRGVEPVQCKQVVGELMVMCWRRFGRRRNTSRRHCTWTRRYATTWSQLWREDTCRTVVELWLRCWTCRGEWWWSKPDGQTRHLTRQVDRCNSAVTARTCTYKCNTCMQRS